MVKNVVFTLLLITLSGCSWIPSVGPDYDTPALPSITEWKMDEASNAHFEKASSLAAEWWKQFNDPVLDELIQKALKSSPSLAAASARLVQARALTQGVESTFFPSVDASYEAKRSQNSLNTKNGKLIPGPQNVYATGFDALWELDLFGGIRRQVEAQVAQEEAQEALLDTAGITLVSEVATNYIGYRTMSQRLNIAKKNVDIQKETENLVRAKFEAGMSSELDLQQATAQLESTRAIIPTLERDLQSRLQRVAVLSGEIPQTFTIRSNGSDDIPSFRNAIGITQPADLLRTRPDVRSAERLVAERTAEIGIAIAELFPKINLVGGIGWQSNTSGDLLSHQSRYWSFGPSVSMPIFQGGKAIAGIRYERARAEEALKSYETAVLSALEDAQNSLNAYNAELLRVASLQRSFEASSRALQLSQDLYREGLIDFLRVLDSERAVFAAEDALLQSKQTVSTSAITVYKAFAGSVSGEKTL